MTNEPKTLLAFACAFLAACGHGEHHAEADPELETTHPLRETTTVTREYVCQIRAAQHIELRALESGYLQEIYVDEGQTVAEGDRLFQITPVIYQAELARADAEARFADVEYRNTEALQRGNVVSDNELALARANRAKARAARALARAHLDFTHISAPFDGIIGWLHVRHGSLLEEGELLTELSDNSEMWVYFNVSEAEYLDYRQHARIQDEPVPVRLRMANGELFDQVGQIQTIEADFNNATGTIAFRAGFENPDRLLRHGETGEILMDTVVEDALIIPQKATFDVLDKKFVYVVDDEGIVHQRQITVADELPHIYLVSEGIGEEDVVLLEGLRRVREGSHVVATHREAREVLASLDVPAE